MSATEHHLSIRHTVRMQVANLLENWFRDHSGLHQRHSAEWPNERGECSWHGGYNRSRPGRAQVGRDVRLLHSSAIAQPQPLSKAPHSVPYLLPLTALLAQPPMRPQVRLFGWNRRIPGRIGDGGADSVEEPRSFKGHGRADVEDHQRT